MNRSQAAILCGILAIVLITTLAYWPALGGAFLWDDNWLIVKNELVHAPNGLWRMWFTTDAHYYWPVTNTFFWSEWRLFDGDPRGFHVVNLAVHIGSALLVWRILRRLDIPGAPLAALLWAVHPTSVEGVAWISQLKTVLSAFFCLLSVDWFLRSDAAESRNGIRWYWLSLLAFAAGMLSKASIAPLPLALLLIIWWSRSRDGRVTSRDLQRVLPFIVVAAPLVLVNMWFETHGSGEVFRQANFLQRLLGAGAVPWFYLGKALVPLNLMFIYPEWNADPAQLRWWLPLTGTIGVTALLCWRRNTWWGRPLLFAWGIFCIALIPVLGFTDVSLMKYTLVSDHYQYLSLIAVTAFVAAAWSVWVTRTPATLLWLPRLTAAAVVCVLGVLTWRESSTYRDARTLLVATIERNPECWVAYCGLGIELGELKQWPAALEQFQQALQFNPDYDEAHKHLGEALINLGRAAEALPHLQRALQTKPQDGQVRLSLGAALLEIGRASEAIDELQEAVALDGSVPEAHYNLGVAYAKGGNWPKAADCQRQAVHLKPDYQRAWANLAFAAAEIGLPREAIAAGQQAVDLARLQNKPEMARQLEGWLVQYRAEHP